MVVTETEAHVVLSEQYAYYWKAVFLRVFSDEVSNILIPNLHGIPTTEHEINMKVLKKDIKHFLDGKVYDYKNRHTLILCNVICVKELVFQVRYTFEFFHNSRLIR